MIDHDKLRAACALLREAIPDRYISVGVHGAPEAALEPFELATAGRSYIGDVAGGSKTVTWVEANVAGVSVALFGPHVPKLIEEQAA